MACGTPAIISKVGGNIGSIRDNEGGFYFEAGNAADLAEKIIYLLTNEEVYKANQKLSREFIIANYSWDKTIDKYVRAIDGLTKN